jgi:hypothetical protein
MMGAMFGMGIRPFLQPGERISLPGKRIWWLTTKSSPSYRIAFATPPLLDIKCVVTDRRLIISAQVVVLFRQEFSIWFPGHESAGEADVLKSVGTGKTGAGTFIETLSENTATHWYRSPELRVRFYTSDRELLAAIQRGLPAQ